MAEDTRAPSFGFPNPQVRDTPAEKERVVPAVKRGPGRPAKASLKAQLTAELTFLGTTVFFVNRYDGQVILTKASDTAEALDKLASENPKIKKALENMLSFSTWSAVGMALASIAVPIAANHNLAPDNFAAMFGVPSPSRYALENPEPKSEDRVATP